MRRGSRTPGIAAAVGALALVAGLTACGDDDDTDRPTPGTQSELDGGEAGTGGETSTTTPPGSVDDGTTGGGTTSGATEGNQMPPG